MAHMQTVNTYNEAKNLFDLSYSMSPKAGVWGAKCFVRI